MAVSSRRDDALYELVYCSALPVIEMHGFLWRRVRPQWGSCRPRGLLKFLLGYGHHLCEFLERCCRWPPMIASPVPGQGAVGEVYTFLGCSVCCLAGRHGGAVQQVAQCAHSFRDSHAWRLSFHHDCNPRGYKYQPCSSLTCWKNLSKVLALRNCYGLHLIGA